PPTLRNGRSGRHCGLTISKLPTQQTGCSLRLCSVSSQCSLFHLLFAGYSSTRSSTSWSVRVEQEAAEDFRVEAFLEEAAFLGVAGRRAAVARPGAGNEHFGRRPGPKHERHPRRLCEDLRRNRVRTGADVISCHGALDFHRGGRRACVTLVAHGIYRDDSPPNPIAASDRLSGALAVTLPAARQSHAYAASGASRYRLPSCHGAIHQSGSSR